MITFVLPRRTCRVLAGLHAIAIGLLLASTLQAGPIPEFTGYTRVGYPSGEGKIEKIVPAAGKDAKDAKEAKDDKDGKEGKDGKDAKTGKEILPLGVTIYYMVLDQRAGGKAGAAGDVFGTGIKDFDRMFVAGRELDRDRFDTDARYLYLYQVVNDSGRESAVKSVSVRLIVDPRLITSWGYFGERRVTDKKVVVRRGVGFTAAFPNPKAKGADDATMIRPVSAEFPAVADRRYQSPAPAIRAEKPYGFAMITLRERPVAVGDDVGKDPEAVFLLSNAYFGEDAGAPYLRPALPSDTDSLPNVEDPKARARMTEQWRTRFPAVRAVWTDEEAVKPRERSTIWGFTSDYPPTLEIASVGHRAIGLGVPEGRRLDGKDIPAIGPEKKGDAKKGEAKGPELRDAGEGLGPIGPAAGLEDAVRTGIPTLLGMVPTPIPPARTVTAAPVESVGGVPSGGGLAPAPQVGGSGALGGGRGGAIPAVTPPSPFLAGRGNGGGGGIGGGFGGGGGNQGVADTSGRQSDNQTGTQNQIQDGSSLTNNVSVNVNQQQKQQQQQQQQQQQKQSQGGGTPHGNMVPAPPAWLLGLLGLPIFAALARRRKTKAASAEKPPVV